MYFKENDVAPTFELENGVEMLPVISPYSANIFWATADDANKFYARAFEKIDDYNNQIKKSANWWKFWK